MSYDNWKQTDPADATLGRSNGQPPRFFCRDCKWTGHGYSAKAVHFYSTQHRIVWSGDSRQSPPAKSEVA